MNAPCRHRTAPEQEFALFAFLYHPDAPGGPVFEKVSNPLGVVGVQGTEPQDCLLADLNADGHLDFVLAAYDTGFHPDLQRPEPELLSGVHSSRRRRHGALPTSVWLNPGWADTFEAPFTQGEFPSITDKVYHVNAADLDKDGLLELITTGALTVTLFDDPPTAE